MILNGQVAETNRIDGLNGQTISSAPREVETKPKIEGFRGRIMTIDDTIRIRLTGAAGLVCSYKDENVLVDPYYSRIGKWRAFFGKLSPNPETIRREVGGIKKITAIVAGHTHLDHVLDLPELARYTEGPIIGSRSLETLLAINGLKGRTTVCRGGEFIQVADAIQITMLPSVHGRVLVGLVPYSGEISPGKRPPLRAKDYRAGHVFSPKMTVGRKVFLHVGSAGFMEESLKGHACDVVFLCIPGWKRMKGYPERILETTGAKTAVLFHQDDFSSRIQTGKPMRTVPFADVEGLIQKIRSFSPDVKVLVPTIGDTLIF